MAVEHAPTIYRWKSETKVFGAAHCFQSPQSPKKFIFVTATSKRLIANMKVAKVLYPKI